MAKKISFVDKRERGVDFLKFLEKEEENVTGLTKQELKTLYIDKYRKYRESLHPKECQIQFAQVLQTLFVSGKLHLRGMHIHPGPAVGQFLNSDSNLNKNENSNGNEYYQDWRPTPRRFMYYRNQPRQYAVDQHRMFYNNADLYHNTYDYTTQQWSGPYQHPQPFQDQQYGMDQPYNGQQFNQQYNSNQQHKEQQYSNNQQHMNRSPQYSKRNRQLEQDNEDMEPDASVVKRTGVIFECSACSAKSTSLEEMNRHVQGRRHRLGLITSELKKQRNTLIKDKEGVIISADGCECSNGTYYLSLEENIPKTLELLIENKNKDEDIELLHCEMLKRVRVFSLDDRKKVTESQATVHILPGKQYIVKVTAWAKNIGNFHVPVAFHFRHTANQGKEFHIIRYINAKSSNQITKQLQPTQKFQHPPKTPVSREKLPTIKGYELPKLTRNNLEKTLPLKEYRIPESVRSIINRGFKAARTCTQAEKLEINAIRSVIQAPVQMHTYIRKFSTLLYVEEIQMEVDIRKYDMKAVPMSKWKGNQRLLKLEVPGLAENRPSVMRGDWLYVRTSDDGHLGNEEYQGYVHEVLLNDVSLGFHESLVKNYVKNSKFNVRFTFNRLPLKLQHRACELAIEEGIEKVLFPTKNTICTRGELDIPKNIKFFNKLIEKNREQKMAVTNIVKGTSRPAPYIVFGPPGTGKTVTIVEAMNQVYRYHKDSHILACAPSNMAADILAERLLVGQQVSRQHMLRLNATSRPWSTVPSSIKDLCNYDKMNDQYFFPSKKELTKYRVIICTIVSAGRLTSANFPLGHFSHVFIDEAGHAVETESLIAIAGLLNCDPGMQCGQLVLAGDPKQLGPILRSPIAVEYGLDISLLERYMNSSVYKRQDKPDKSGSHYDNRVITKLLMNYRSHPAILKEPNKMFYDNELIPMADGQMRCSLCDWEKLPRKNFPVIFHGVVGRDMREERSPSFFNAEEASIVHSYVSSLLKDKKTGIKVQEKDIGIISPYRKQVQKIRSLMNLCNWRDIQIGSVEEFQGQERLVIIVSTVRSNPEYLSLDMNFKLGFLKNPKRFNVTVTRAKALMIVIGDPHTLSKDKHWKSFIDYCVENKAYTGVDFVPEEEMVEDIMQRLGSINLNTNEIVEDAEEAEKEVKSFMQKASDLNEKEWRKDI